MAEGAEKKRLEILEQSEGFAAGATVNDSKYISSDWEGISTADCELYIIPVSSLLAPASGPVKPHESTPEEEKQYRLAMGRAALDLDPLAPDKEGEK